VTFDIMKRPSAFDQCLLSWWVVGLKPPPQKRELYAMAMFFCLSVRVRSFVRLSCRLKRVLLMAAGAYRVGHSDRTDLLTAVIVYSKSVGLKPIERIGNYSAASNNMKLVHYPLMGGLLHLVH